MGRLKKEKVHEIAREDSLATADILTGILKAAVVFGPSAATWVWVFTRVPYRFMNQGDVDLLCNWKKPVPGAKAVTITPDFDVKEYDTLGRSTKNWDRFTIGPNEYKITPVGTPGPGRGAGKLWKGVEVTSDYTNLLWASRTEFRDDMLVASGLFWVIMMSQVEIGLEEQAAALTAFIVAMFSAVELIRFEHVFIDFKKDVTQADGSHAVFTYRLESYEIPILDRIGFSAVPAALVAKVMHGLITPKE